MQKPYAVIVGGLIAYILLLVYSFTVTYMIKQTIDFVPEDGRETLVIHEGIMGVVTALNGLLSALVISKLAITKPGNSPTIMQAATNAQGKQERWVSFFVITYLVIWVFAGCASLVVGVMFYPKINQTISDIGTTWLGLAVAALYAYFCITPDNGGTAS